MSTIPEQLKYTKTHEWVRVESDGTLTVGITDHAQDLLGDMVYVELPDVGLTVEGAQDCAVAESVKAASDVYAPVAGEIIEVNNRLEESPDLLNKSPYEEGWIFRMRPANPADVEGLLDVAAYSAAVAAEAH